MTFAARKLYNHGLAIAIVLACHGTALAAAQPVQAIVDNAAQAKPAFIDLLARMVNIDSGTGSTKGLDQVGAIVAGEAKKLGMRVEFSSAAPAAGNNLVASPYM